MVTSLARPSRYRGAESRLMCTRPDREPRLRQTGRAEARAPGSALRPCPGRHPTGARGSRRQTSTALIPSSRDDGTRPFLRRARRASTARTLPIRWQRTSSTTCITTQICQSAGGTRRGAQVRDRKRRRERARPPPSSRRGPGSSSRIRVPARAATGRWGGCATCAGGEGGNWRFLRLASGYERVKARHLVPRQNWKYCLLNSQPRPVTRTVNNRQGGTRRAEVGSLLVALCNRTLLEAARPLPPDCIYSEC